MQHRSKANVKREHHILAELKPLLEQIGNLAEVQSIVPGRIKPVPGSAQTQLRLQYATPSGLKLMGQSGRVVQEVFVTTDQTEEVVKKLGELKLIKAN